MKHWIKLFAALAASAAFVTTAGAFAFANSSQTGGSTVAVAKTRLGRILVDSKGITLYDFVTDKHAASGCYGACAALWPPLITEGKPGQTTGQGVNQFGGPWWVLSPAGREIHRG